GGLMQIYHNGGTVRLEGTNVNTYGGLTIAAGGTLELAITNFTASGPAIPNSMVLSNDAVVRLFEDFELYQPSKSVTNFFTMYPGSRLDTANHNEWIGALSMQAAQITTGGGVLFLNSDITVVSNNIAPSTITGIANLFSSTHTITTAGHSFSPDLSFTAR